MSKPVIIDVREPIEFKLSHVKGAINIPPTKLMSGEPTELKDLPRDTLLVLYCRTGARSNSSMQFIQDMGFTNVVNGINQQHVEKNYIS